MEADVRDRVLSADSGHSLKNLNAEISAAIEPGGVVGAGDAPPVAALAEERAAFLRRAATSDQAEGLRGFIEKRRPTFTGQ